MTHFIRFRSVLLGAALVAAPAACNKDNDTANDSDRAAERVRDKVEDLREESRDVVETARERVADRDDVDETVDDAHDVAENARDNRDDVREKAAGTAEAVIDEHQDVAEQAMDVKHAQFDFGYARLTRVGTLRAIHGLAQSQPALINAFAHDVELTDKERGLINEKLMIFQNRLDEAGNQLETLATVPAETWEQRHADANRAMERLEDAREDAWEALHDADRADDRTSMR